MYVLVHEWFLEDSVDKSLPLVSELIDVQVVHFMILSRSIHSHVSVSILSNHPSCVFQCNKMGAYCMQLIL